MDLFALVFVLSVSGQTADGFCDPLCERKAAEESFEKGEIRPAIERLRSAVETHPDDAVLPLLLARAYLLDGNLFWAEKVLRSTIDLRPDDVEPRAWLALVHIRQGDPELARDALAAIPEPSDGPNATRLTLLSAYHARLSGDVDAARSALRGLSRAAPAFAEDRPVFDILRRRAEPAWIPPVSGQFESAFGGTTNALAGAPTDPGVSGDPSALLDARLQLRVAPAMSHSVRLVVDLETDAHLVFAQQYREFSSLEASARPGVLVSRGRYRTFVGYRAEVLDRRRSSSPR